MNPVPPATVLSLLHNFGSLEVLGDRADHPFAATYEQSTVVLENLIQASHQLSHSLAIHSSASITNPKLVSILRQHGSLLQSSRIVSSSSLSPLVAPLADLLVVRADIVSLNRCSAQAIDYELR
jgi:hypothetical protein